VADFVFTDGTVSSDTNIVPVPVVTGDEDTDALIAIKHRYLALLAQAPLQPKVTYTVHGHNYKWNEFQQILPELIANINRLLQAQDPFFIVSQGVT
jgi:hypothetical protein